MKKQSKTKSLSLISTHTTRVVHFSYFRKGPFFGLACFANMPVESELERGARMKSVGILSPSYTLLYRYMHFLENQVRYVPDPQMRAGSGCCQLVSLRALGDQGHVAELGFMPRVVVFSFQPMSQIIIIHALMKAGADFAFRLF